MPIKEIMTLGIIIMSGWYVTGGQRGMLKNIQETKVKILREVTRTDNWGNPSIWGNGKTIRRIR